MKILSENEPWPIDEGGPCPLAVLVRKGTLNCTKNGSVATHLILGPRGREKLQEVFSETQWRREPTSSKKTIAWGLQVLFAESDIIEISCEAGGVWA